MRFGTARASAAICVGMVSWLIGTVSASGADYTRLHQMLLDAYPVIESDSVIESDDAPAAAAAAAADPSAEGSAEDQVDLLYAEPPPEAGGTQPEPSEVDPPTGGEAPSATMEAMGGAAGDAGPPAAAAAATAEAAADSSAAVPGADAAASAPIGPDEAAAAADAAPVADAPTQQAPVAARDRYLVQFQPDATAAEVDRVLEKYDLRVIPPEQQGNSIPEAGILHVEQLMPAAATAAEADSVKPVEDILSPKVIEELRDEDSVRTAIPDLVLSGQVLSLDSDTFGFDRNNVKHVWDWRPHGPTGNDGNWGLKYGRFPAAWTIVGKALKRNPEMPRIPVGILDGGISSHEDLVFRIANVGPARTDAHGNHVAGIVGATHNNSLGVAGGALHVDLLFGQLDRIETEGSNTTVLFNDAMSLAGEVSNTLAKMILRHPEMRVVNISLGLNWRTNASGLDPGGAGERAAQARNVTREFGTMLQTILEFPQAERMVFVSAAGNDSHSQAPNIEAQWSSPVNWAGLNLEGLDRKIIVVEAVDRVRKRAGFSNIGGNVSAPGVGVLSTVSSGYGVMGGTSMAAPHVSGLLALLFLYNPDLTAEEAVSLVIDTAAPSTDLAAPHIDALEALLRSNRQAIIDLADLNSDGAVDSGDYTIQQEDLAALAAPGVSVTRDLNGDGLVGEAEDAWPLADLNGSGAASMGAQDGRRILGRTMADVEVLRTAWTDETVSFAEASGQAQSTLPVAEGGNGQPIATSSD